MSPEKSLEERCRERPTDQAIALLAVEVSRLQDELENYIAIGNVVSRLEKTVESTKKELIAHIAEKE